MTDEPIARFWQRFLACEAARRLDRPMLHDSISIGSTAQSADEGARLILDGLKTATSSLPGEHGTPLHVGALSILLDGAGTPVAVLETAALEARTLDELDGAFAQDYGEWDLSVETLRRELQLHYAPALDDPRATLLCERFRVVFRA